MAEVKKSEPIDSLCIDKEYYTGHRELAPSVLYSSNDYHKT